MTVTTAEGRRAASGVWLLLPGVTPNAAKDAEWRRQSGWSYTPAGAPAPVVEEGGAFWPERVVKRRRLEDQIRRRRRERLELRRQLEEEFGLRPRRVEEPVPAIEPEIVAEIPGISPEDLSEALRLAERLRGVEVQINLLAAEMLRQAELEDEEDAIALLLL